MSDTLCVRVLETKTGQNYARFDRKRSNGFVVKTVLFGEEFVRLSDVFAEMKRNHAIGAPRWLGLNIKGTKITEVTEFAGKRYLGVSIRDPVSGERVRGTGFNFVNSELEAFGSVIAQIVSAVDPPPVAPTSPRLVQSPVAIPSTPPTSPLASHLPANELEVSPTGMETPSPGFSLTPFLMNALQKRTRKLRGEGGTPSRPRLTRSRRIVKKLAF